MAPIEIGGYLDFVDGEAVDGDVQRHRLDGRHPVAGLGRNDALLAGHKGQVHAVILEDGTTAYAPHHGDLSTLSLKKGDTVTITGKGGNYALGRALVITTIKLPNGTVKSL